MRTPQEAIIDILDHVLELGEVERVSLSQATGRVLAEDVFSDVDVPPFQKSAMDGYAVHSADFDPESVEERALEILGESRAGGPYGGRIERGTCIAIYTGAEVPPDCDAVVAVEQTTQTGSRVRIADRIAAGKNICNQGEDLRKGARVMSARRRLGPTDLSVLATVGCEPVPVFRRPRVSVLTTGDELVAAVEVPGPGQIREGNTLHLAALAARAGADVIEVARVPDREDELLTRFGAALASSDAVITTGGVSMGKYDLVAEAFKALRVSEVFHKVAIKPGKPMWFGMQGRTPVFALPGNPVSCLIDHEVFVRPALAKLAGAASGEWIERLRTGRWEGKPTRVGPRQQNVPVTVAQGPDGIEALTPLAWSSSADIVGLAEADGMAVVPPGAAFATGDLVLYRPLA